MNLKARLGQWSRKTFVSWYVKHSFDTNGTIGIQTLIPLLGQSPLIIEIGAHTGTDTQKFASAFPRGRIYAFEPHPKLFCMALQATACFHNVTLVPVALGNSLGFQIFRQSSGTSDGSGSLLEPAAVLARHPTVHFRKQDEVVVATSTLDEYAAMSGIERIDLIWIDAQGAEGLIFEGATTILKCTKYVYAEISTISEYKGALTYSQIKCLLARSGLHPLKEFMPPEWQGSGNVLFGRLV